MGPHRAGGRSAVVAATVIVLDQRQRALETTQHEAAHLAAAICLGLEVGRVRLDRWRDEGWTGAVEGFYPGPAMRDALEGELLVAEMERAIAVVARTGVLMCPLTQRWSDPSAALDRELVERVRSDGWTPAGWALATELRAEALVRTEAFQTAWAALVPALDALEAEGELDGEEVAAIVDGARA